MSETLESIRAFVEYRRSLSGYEKGEAQVFCDRLFQAFGHEGYKEAGASLEGQVKPRGKATKFIDLLWRPRLLLEMKSRGEKLQKHYQQAFDYWLNATPDRRTLHQHPNLCLDESGRCDQLGGECHQKGGGRCRPCLGCIRV